MVITTDSGRDYSFKSYFFAFFIDVWLLSLALLLYKKNLSNLKVVFTLWFINSATRIDLVWHPEGELNNQERVWRNTPFVSAVPSEGADNENCGWSGSSFENGCCFCRFVSKRESRKKGRIVSTRNFTMIYQCRKRWNVNSVVQYSGKGGICPIRKEEFANVCSSIE